MTTNKRQNAPAIIPSELTTLDPQERAQLRKQALWRVRLRLMGQSLHANWRLFTENPIGLIGLSIIVFMAVWR